MGVKVVKKTIWVLILALIVGGLLRLCVFTSYYIPSDGMANTLRCGERIFVNKWSYGWRLPFMKLWGYHRLAESPVERGDVVVFNNPAHRNRSTAIDCREVYIGRCCGLPGERLLLDSHYSVVTNPVHLPDQRLFYVYPNRKHEELSQLLQKLNVDVSLQKNQEDSCSVCSLSRYEYYLVQQSLPIDDCWLHPYHNAVPDSAQLMSFVMPRCGQTVYITPQNCTLICNTLLLHEQRDAFIKNDTLYLDDKPINSYKFTKDYYWVTSDNAGNVQDSRLFGLLPADHIIGRATYIWFSKQWERIGQYVY